jgi:DNA excision repair protein ERCC-4
VGELVPVIVIDTREQQPLPVDPHITGTLQTGDYSILGCEHMFSVERKSVEDIVSSVIHDRDRFERELHRLRGFRFKRILITGTEDDITLHRYTSKANPKSVLQSLLAFEVRYEVPVVWGGPPERCALLIQSWAFWFAREIKAAAKHLSEVEA